MRSPLNHIRLGTTALATLLLIACFPVSCAFSWVYAPSGVDKSTVSPQPRPTNLDGKLPPEELAVILQGTRSFDAYNNKPDCFRRAANDIQIRCRELESDEDQRVKAAISMTLCEIATAKYASLPMECAPFQSDSSGMYALPGDSSGKCVSALSRSAQYWSSYSGYLREVAQLCFAYQRWNDIDVAKELYQKASIEAIDTLRYMADREKHVSSAYEDSKSIYEAMQAILEDIRASSMTLDNASAVASQSLGSLRSEILNELEAVFLDIQERIALGHTRTVSKMGADISELINDLGTTMHSMQSNFEKTLAYHIGDAFSLLEMKLYNITQIMYGTSSFLLDFQKTFEILHQTTVLLTLDARQGRANMEAHLQASHMALEKQLAVAAISDNVSSVMSQLVVFAHAGVQDLNETIAYIKNNTPKTLYDDWTTAWLWFQRCMLQLLRVDPSLFQHPVFHMAYHTLRVCGLCVGFLCSRIVTGSVFLASAWTLFLRTSKIPVTDQLLLSVFPGSPRARTRHSTEGHPPQLDGDLLNDRTRGLSLSVGPASSPPTRSARRRPRVSRIPDRLCGHFS